MENKIQHIHCNYQCSFQKQDNDGQDPLYMLCSFCNVSPSYPRKNPEKQSTGRTFKLQRKYSVRSVNDNPSRKADRVRGNKVSKFSAQIFQVKST